MSNECNPSLRKIYDYVNKIFADQSVLLRSIENVFNDSIRKHKAAIQIKTDEIDTLIASMAGRLSTLKFESNQIKAIQMKLLSMEEEIKFLHTKQRQEPKINLTTQLQNIANYS